MLWAHEFGHSKGLGHNPSLTALMAGTFVPVLLPQPVLNLDVSPNECRAFRNTPTPTSIIEMWQTLRRTLAYAPKSIDFLRELWY